MSRILLFLVQTLQCPLERLSIAPIKYISVLNLVQTSYSMSRKSYIKNGGEGEMQTHGTHRELAGF